MSIKLRSFTLLLVLLAVLFTSFAGAQDTKKVQGKANPPILVTGDLGSLNTASKASLHASAKSSLNRLLNEKFAADGDEEMTATKVMKDKTGGVHIRFEQQLNGLPVAGAGMVVHADANGSIYAINGDFIPSAGLPTKPNIKASDAFNKANIKGTRTSPPELNYVIGRDGLGHLTWKASFKYVNYEGPQRDLVFVDTITGKVAARHPQIMYGRSLITQDCNQKTRRCRSVSTSSDTISSGDQAIDDAHNYAIATYDYYLNNHGRDSIDNAGMTLKSRVHYSRNYNNAFWDGSQMTYGDGDGVTFAPLSQDADVVAHELTHGVTERSSGLIYQNESGALNEAWSDIFGAMVDRQEGAAGSDIWLIGEDIYTPGAPGDALRNMADPASMGDYDYYPDRYTGSSDNGGVHWNSGIANLAFQLLVDGGQHPRNKTPEVTVTGIGFDDAAAIFYAANINCLTPSSNFASARYCTALQAKALFDGGQLSSDHQTSIHLAWDAVGVPSNTPPESSTPIELTDKVVMNDQSASSGEIQHYFLEGVSAGKTVTCSTSCSNGDADLYLRFNALAEANPNSNNNECGSYSEDSNESCTTGAPSSDATTLNAAVHAYASYSSLSLTCLINSDDGGGSCAIRGSSCSLGSECCSGNCGGKPGSRTCRK
ncbi:peptidase M4 thermolysin [Shewanella halifaxensis HAW-EB4]|uniref:Neutral metalloproteinase n=1 Tax=Shewanella halifaxensis (strain HAW-EB4) TaxID=458817 RepID=B0TT87_SHEHH|nr:M4 family metallopeptidase [Shewanella halifaxensis]ABZ78028.1 peptidase M4 thermolysin [Shewanella halifaxensis HAW-EB4]